LFTFGQTWANTAVWQQKARAKTQQIALELCLFCSPGRAFAKFSEPKKLWKYAVEQVCYFYFFLPFLFSTKVQQN